MDYIVIGGPMLAKFAAHRAAAAGAACARFAVAHGGNDWRRVAPGSSKNVILGLAGAAKRP
jgi:hypothetical protein